MSVQPYQLNGYQETVMTAFIRQNKIAVPGRVTSFTNLGGKKQPTITKNFLQTENVGKSPNINPVLDVYVENSVQVS